MEAEGGPFPKSEKWATQKAFCAQEPHRALLGHRSRWLVKGFPTLKFYDHVGHIREYNSSELRRPGSSDRGLDLKSV